MAGYIGSKAVNLSTTGADINGDANIDGDLSFRDNDKAIFGAGSDLQIYHSGSHSVIKDAGDGNLQLIANDFQLRNGADNANMMTGANGGAVTLMHNGSSKLATTSTGIDVTGTVTADSLTVNSGTNNTVAKFESSDAGAFIILEDSGSTNDGNRIAVEGDVMSFATGDSERMRIDSSGRLLVGKTASGVTNDGFEVHSNDYIASTRNGGTTAYFNRRTNDGDIVEFRKNNTTVGSIGTLNASEFGISSSNDLVLTQNTTTQRNLLFRDSFFGPFGADNGAIDLGRDTSKFRNLYLSGNAYADNFIGTNDTNTFIAMTGGDVIRHFTGGSERVRIDSSGNLLVGQSSTTVPGAGNTTAGTSIRGTDGVFISRTTSDTSASALQVNKTTGQGAIINIASGGSTVGTIGTLSGFIYIGNGDCNLLFTGGTDQMLPVGTNGATKDGQIDLGSLGNRFDDIYATNGTIQTSDRNEKQDIAELSDAEQRVAVAAKGLLRKFRWKSAVEAKGDEARTHFGIIAQDLQAAFAAEGLDAGDYAMFISSTWTDEETGEERTRMGVRYSELLAFIIGAL